ncbi:MAG: YbfB/YjiJ family MFS transporter [Peptococcaceae bacterium]|nr:YbfB/YjiJ family MFS transporter [Peptococcaceae bacterium]
MKKYKIHYGWAILAVGILVVAGSLGFGRFGYSMILPSMQAGLGLGHDQTGIIASANMSGYVLAALGVGVLASRYGPRMIIAAALFWTGLTMAATALAGGLASLVILRFLTGMGSAGGNISIMGLASSWFSARRRGMACGFLVGGSGLAIAITGWVVPLINGTYPVHGWRYCWLALGVLILVIGVLALLFIRNTPREKGLEPVGGAEPAISGSAAAGERDLGVREIFYHRGVPILTVIYFCFGFSYIIYAMFFVNFLVGEKGLSQAAAGSVWSLVGFLSIGSAVIWGTLSDVIGRRLTIAIVFTLQVISYTLPVATTAMVSVWISAVIYGLTAWSIPGLVASYCGDLVGPKNAPAALGLVTFFFGIGSVLGPACAGYIKELSRSFGGAFYLAALIALTGAFLSLLRGRTHGPASSAGTGG